MNTTLTVTPADLIDGFYREHNMISNGDIQIEPHLGQVLVRGSIRAVGSIVAGSGTGIKAGSGIGAGGGIKAGCGINAGEGIKADWGIAAGKGIDVG